MSVQSHIADFWKIHLKKNAKTPIYKWTNKENHHKAINPAGYNIGILTGTINNLSVVDIDKKDNGVDEMQRYIAEFGDIDTFTVQSPNEGYHLYFRYDHPNEDDAFLIRQYMKNMLNFRGVGIDVRSNGGYIVAPGSTIKGRSYNIIKDLPILNIPSHLLNWLVVGATKESEPSKKGSR